MNIRFDDSILQDFGDLCSTFFSSTPMFSIEPIKEKPLRSAEAVFLFALFIKINKNRLAAALVQQEGNRQ